VIATSTIGAARGALALTFDNLGEAADLERGLWPAERPVGRDPSVVSALPAVLDALDACELRATFFVEAINCEIYPDAVRAIAARGHEIGHHGWRHERWSDLDAARERELLSRGLDAFAALGIAVGGFRPPGGELTPRTAALLREHGLRWCSPLADGARVDAGLAVIGFRWQLVDAYHRLAGFADLRTSLGDDAAPLDAAQTAARLRAQLEPLARDGGRLTLILHPFLAEDSDGLAALRELLRAIASLRAGGDVWVGRGGDLAAWLLA
jgi:peptidoglycan/xylan/chitin deacetylase (PgdA/CDA1 family)